MTKLSQDFLALPRLLYDIFTTYAALQIFASTPHTLECSPILVWRLKTSVREIAHESEIENKAIKFVAYSFFILSIYISFEACRKLHFHEIPESSPIGIIMTLLSLLIMPVLAQQKYKIGKALNSRALVADSKETVACCFLSGIALMGLLLNHLWGLWWADPIASLGIVVFLVKEGRELLKNEDEDLD